MPSVGAPNVVVASRVRVRKRGEKRRTILIDLGFFVSVDSDS